MPTALTSSMMQGQTSTICVSTARRSAKRHSSARRRTLKRTRDILRYAGGNVHDGDGALYPILRGGRRKPPTFFHEHDGGQRK